MSQGTHLAKMTSYVHLLILVPIILEENMTCKPQNSLYLLEFALLQLGYIGKCSSLKDHSGVPIFSDPSGVLTHHMAMQYGLKSTVHCIITSLIPLAMSTCH